MTYELAKQLKDAGFPLNMSDHLECVYNKTEFIDGIWYHVPTLSELIEACGTCQLNWYADAKHAQALADGNIGEGSTPEEAVANLWLALNTKT